MSRIEITVGNATADITSNVDSLQPDGTFPHYSPRDLMDAAAAALLAINTPTAVKWAHELYRITAAPPAQPKERPPCT